MDHQPVLHVFWVHSLKLSQTGGHKEKSTSEHRSAGNGDAGIKLHQQECNKRTHECKCNPTYVNPFPREAGQPSRHTQHIICAAFVVQG